VYQALQFLVEVQNSAIFDRSPERDEQTLGLRRDGLQCDEALGGMRVVVLKEYERKEEESTQIRLMIVNAMFTSG
jgi:hypothetical protein